MTRPAGTSTPARPARHGHPFTKPPLPGSKKRGKPVDPLPLPPRLEQLRRMAGVDDDLARIHQLLTSYKLERRGHPEIHRQLDRIEEHQREQRLFLGVVGEFSSGKSTLLNALLRDDLLRTDILQGTTAAATLLTYGPQLGVTVRNLPSHPIVRVFKVLWKVMTFPVALFQPGPPRDREGVRALIHRHTAVEEVARRVAQVEVSHPAECLRQGLVIVDLPGTNAENVRHGNVTAGALADFCDAAVVVVPADSPGSETLWGFLTNHLDPEVLRRCVFVLNKIDLIRRPREREQLVANLEARLKRDLHIDKPRVVPAAPERVLEAAGLIAAADDPDFALTPDQKAHWVAAFEKAEGTLWTTLKEQKLLLQVERLARLLTQVFEQLAAVLQARDAEHAERHAALQAGLAQIPDLKQFVTAAREKHCGAYANQVVPVAEACGEALGRVQATTMRALAKVVFATSSKKELQEALEGEVPSIVSASQSELRRALGAAIATLEKAAEVEHREFHAHFQKLYRNLATLGGRVRTETRGLDRGAASSFAAGTEGTPASLAQDVAQVRTEDLWKKAGGAGAGAIVGTLILPGVGTLIGGVLGGLFGALFGPSFAEIQQRCWNGLEAAVINGFEKFMPQAEANLARAASEIEEQLAAVIGRYAEQYRKLVDKMIARDEQDAAELERLRQKIQRDLEDIKARQARLAQARAHLRTL